MMIVCALFEIAKAQAQFYKADIDGTRNRTGMNHIGVNNIESLHLEIMKWVRKRHQEDKKKELRLVKDIE